MTGEARSYYERLDTHRFRPTEHAQGAWRSDEQHMAPVAGIVVHAVEQYQRENGRDHLAIGRVAFDILGRIEATDFTVDVEVIRPGRQIELIEATVTGATGRPSVRARIWLLEPHDTAVVAGTPADPMPGPDGLVEWAVAEMWDGGFVASIQGRLVEPRRPGRARVWLSTDVDLVAGEPASDLARLMGLVDTANGVGARVGPTEWMFPNVDLTVHLFRTPVGRWIGLDTTASFSADGRGLTSSVLHDEHGPVGTTEQILTVRPWLG